MGKTSPGFGAAWANAWRLDSMRTPFVDDTGAFALVSATDLGVRAARASLAQTREPRDRARPGGPTSRVFSLFGQAECGGFAGHNAGAAWLGPGLQHSQPI